MTREEEIINQSHKYRLSNPSKNKDFSYNGTDLEEAYESGAKWADEHPHKPTREEILKELRSNAEHTERLYTLMGQIPPIEQLAVLQMEEGWKQAIEKAVNWLSLNAELYGGFNHGKLEEMIKKFKKEMEE